MSHKTHKSSTHVLMRKFVTAENPDIQSSSIKQRCPASLAECPVSGNSLFFLKNKTNIYLWSKKWALHNSGSFKYLHFITSRTSKSHTHTEGYHHVTKNGTAGRACKGKVAAANSPQQWTILKVSRIKKTEGLVPGQWRTAQTVITHKQWLVSPFYTVPHS